LGSAPIPVPYADADEAAGIGDEAVAREKAAIEKLLALDELGLSLPPGNKLPRASGDEVSFFTSLCRDPQAAWDWTHFGVSSPEIIQGECRRGLTPMLTEAMKHLHDREWFPFPFQPQVYDIVRNHSEMWPAPPQHGPVTVPSEQDIFFKYFYQANPMSMADTLRAARAELTRYADAANRELAQRIQDGVTLPETWTFADFTPREAERFFGLQQDLSKDRKMLDELQGIRADLVAQLQADPALANILLDPQGRDLREDLWMFEKTNQPWQVLWVPGLMMFAVLLWLLVFALRHQRQGRVAWDAVRLEARGGWHGYVFVLPGMLLLFSFAIYPSLYQFVLATQRGNGLGSMQSVGLDNFSRVLNPGHPQFDIVFWRKVLPNTLLYMLVVTAGQVFFGMMIASLLNLPLRANSTYRVLFFIPLVTSLAIVSVIFIGLLKGEDSGLNQFLVSSGFQDLPYRLGLVDEPGKMINWLGEKTGLWTIMVVGIWHGLPYNIILLLAGLQSISPELYEAARVDGASSAQRFRHVTMPEIMPILLIITFQAFIGAAKAFSLVFVLTEGGINHSSELVSTYIFKWGFMKPEGRDADLGYASALGIVYSVLLAALTLTNVIIIARRWRRRLEMEAMAGGRGVVA